MKWWVWVLAVMVLGGIIGSNSIEDTAPGTGNASNSAATETKSNTVSSDVKNSAFSGDCGISATAEMGTDIIGQPTVTVSVTNTTDKDISAICFYAIPMDVYGEELTGIFSQNELRTDDTISAGKSESCSWQLLDQHVKTVKLYVYSVYFSDGTQWGDKDATKSVILKNGLQIEVSGKSGS